MHQPLGQLHVRQVKFLAFFVQSRTIYVNISEKLLIKRYYCIYSLCFEVTDLFMLTGLALITLHLSYFIIQLEKLFHKLAYIISSFDLRKVLPVLIFEFIDLDQIVT